MKMTDPARSDATRKKRLWMFGLVLLAIAVSFWFARPLGEPDKVEPGKPQAQSTEWAPEPEGEAVPVDLPTTPLKDVADVSEGDVEKAAGNKD
jgi:hypothetical protein